MKIILIEKLPRIIRGKKQLEKKLNLKITNRGKELTIRGSPENEYTGEKVIDAINFGFSISTALLIKEEEDFIFEILNIKDYTKKHDLKRIKARIIGTKGGTLKTLQQLTKCHFELKDNYVGIIGCSELIENAQNAVMSIIQGSKQSNVYNFLERHQFKSADDLGLKE